jgi:ABC-type transport system involved in multi-copper enzyme maturation permease subunit
MRQLYSLLSKDFRIHGRSIAFTECGFLAFIAIANRFLPHSNPHMTPATDAVFVFNVNFVAAAFLWGDWLISREKTKGTFAWLRSTPVPDAVIVRSKLIAGGICCFSLWCISSLLFSRAFYFPAHWLLWWIVLLCLLSFTVLSFGARWILQQKAGAIVPIGIIILISALPFAADALGLDATHKLMVLWNTSAGRATAAGILCVVIILLWVAIETWVAQADTYQLLE